MYVSEPPEPAVIAPTVHDLRQDSIDMIVGVLTELARRESARVDLASEAQWVARQLAGLLDSESFDALDRHADVRAARRLVAQMIDTLAQLHER